MGNHRKSARNLSLCVGGLLLCSTIMLGQIELPIVKTIASTELTAVHLPATSPFCLAFLPISNPSEKGAGNPSPQMLSSLARSGLHPKKASSCYKIMKGNVISVETLKREENQFKARVEFTDLTIPKGEDLATLLRRGYTTLRRLQMASGRSGLTSPR